jgi:ribonuclease BN (tRNA processing enzyme)
VLDLGYGTLPRLLGVLGSSAADGIDAVIVTHQHPDHMIDLHGLFRARWFGHRGAPALPLFAPHGVLARVGALEEADEADDVTQVFDWRPLPAPTYQVGCSFPLLPERESVKRHRRAQPHERHPRDWLMDLPTGTMDALGCRADACNSAWASLSSRTVPQ